MKKYKLAMMNKGYFVGDFEPNALFSKEVELSIKGITKGTLDTGYYRENDEELICVLKGKIESQAITFTEGDILVFDSCEMIEIFALEDSQILIAKFPGTKGDNHKKKWDSYEEFDSFYSYYLNRLREISSININQETVKHSIEGKDISVVVQGYVSEETKFLLYSIRKYLPEAKIIVSTWDYCCVEGLDYDVLVLNSDPGAIPCEIWDNFSRVNNGNRQILSTKNGIDKVTTKYTLKLRSDLVLLGSDFIDYFNKDYVRNLEYCLFEQKIVIGELYSRHSFAYHRNGNEYIVPKPFHPSDWFAFGLTSDLKILYSNVELIPDEELQYKKLAHPDYINKYQYKYAWRYTTEQHIFLSALRQKFSNIKFEDWTDWNDETIEMSEKLMNNNFIFLDLSRSNILNMNYITACFANNGFCHPEKLLYTFSETLDTLSEEH